MTPETETCTEFIKYSTNENSKISIDDNRV